MKTPLLTLTHVSLTMPNLPRPILTEINYAIYPGDFIVILGSNGSGKSSLLKLLDRRYQATSGEILLENQPIAQYSPAAFSHKVVTLTQNCHDSLFASLTLFENYVLVSQRAATPFRSKRQQRQFFADYITQFNANLAHKLDVTVEALSGGEKQALALALSVLHTPQLLLLDEHTSALDPKSAQQLMQLTHKIVQERHITCLLTTHDLAIAEEYGNRILALRHGQIFQTLDHAAKTALDQRSLLEACY